MTLNERRRTQHVFFCAFVFCPNDTPRKNCKCILPMKAPQRKQRISALIRPGSSQHPASRTPFVLQNWICCLTGNWMDAAAGTTGARAWSSIWNPTKDRISRELSNGSIWFREGWMDGRMNWGFRFLSGDVYLRYISVPLRFFVRATAPPPPPQSVVYFTREHEGFFLLFPHCGMVFPYFRIWERV